MDPRHERIRSLEMAGLFKKLPPRTVAGIVNRECSAMADRLYGRALGIGVDNDDFVDPICRQDAMVLRRNHNYEEE